MYGMVNQAIKDLVRTRFGDMAWKNIAERANVSFEDFVFMEYYPDHITYELVGAASEELKLAPDVILSEFGKHWILYTAKEGYGPLMDLFGSDFPTCLKNLNSLHDRMGMTMPNLKPPRFEFEEVSLGCYILTYFSKRPGLSPMVLGLLQGLAIKFGVDAEIEFFEKPETGEKCFRVKNKLVEAA